jgi:predicted RNA-binding Zn-ribbon protein involved in translation (DUF1610 family)
VVPLSKCELRCKCDKCGGPESCDGEPPHECPGAQVIELEDHRRVWQTWWTVCLECAYSGVSVQHEDTRGFLECPGCGQMRVVRTAPATEAPISTKL